MQVGSAAQVTCPRCGHTQPAELAGTRFATCGSCKYTFDTTAPPTAAAATMPHTQQVTKIEGMFRAPSMGYKDSPFPISGAGTCEIGPYHLIVSGFEARGRIVRFLVVIAGLVAAVLAGILIAKLGFSEKTSIAAGFGVFMIGAFMPLPASKEPVEYKIPWPNVTVQPIDRGFSAVRSGTVLINVRNFDPEGEMHFLSKDAGAFVAALQARGFRIK